jgi:hypothetical protein
MEHNMMLQYIYFDELMFAVYLAHINVGKKGYYKKTYVEKNKTNI